MEIIFNFCAGIFSGSIYTNYCCTTKPGVELDGTDSRGHEKPYYDMSLHLHRYCNTYTVVPGVVGWARVQKLVEGIRVSWAYGLRAYKIVWPSSGMRVSWRHAISIECAQRVSAKRFWEPGARKVLTFQVQSQSASFFGLPGFAFPSSAADERVPVHAGHVALMECVLETFILTRGWMYCSSRHSKSQSSVGLTLLGTVPVHHFTTMRRSWFCRAFTVIQRSLIKVKMFSHSNKRNTLFYFQRVSV